MTGAPVMHTLDSQYWQAMFLIELVERCGKYMAGSKMEVPRANVIE